jgi:hypothetical protein
MFRRAVVPQALVATLLVLLPLLGRQPAAAAAKRSVSASVDCIRVLGDTSGLPKIEVTVENRTGVPLAIVYLRAFGTAPDVEGGLTGLKLEAPADDPAIEVADGATQTLDAVWGGVELARSDKIVALILTNAGALLPACGDAKPQTISLAGSATSSKKAADEESATIGAEMIGQLEAWRAYPALYALLHADARQAVSFEAMSCWYVGQYGPPVTDETKTIYSTKVESVKLVDWIWGVTGKRYPDAAEVTQTQTSGGSPEQATPAKATIHLVPEDGVWRWFFGSTPAGVAGLSDSCKLPPSV